MYFFKSPLLIITDFIFPNFTRKSADEEDKFVSENPICCE
jgi:hypothetical protein